MVELSLEFLGLAIVVALAGTVLARSADQIAEITRLGRLLIGSILLAGATSLPELTVDLAAVRQGMPDLAAGDLFGSSLMNLLILALMDLASRTKGKMLSREAAAHALSGTLSICLTSLAGVALLAAPKLPGPAIAGVGLWSWGILVAYLFGVRLLYLDQRLSIRVAADSPGTHTEPAGSGDVATAGHPPLWRPMAWFAAATVVLLLAGPRLAEAAGRLAELSGLGKTFVGTTLVAFCTSLPELVASIAALRMGSIDLVVGNVFGSNVFNMVLFVPLDAVHPGSLFADLSPSHSVTVFAVILATSVAVLGQLYRVETRRRIIEPDAWLMLIILAGALVLVYRLSS